VPCQLVLSCLTLSSFIIANLLYYTVVANAIIPNKEPTKFEMAGYVTSFRDMQLANATSQI